MLPEGYEPVNQLRSEDKRRSNRPRALPWLGDESPFQGFGQKGGRTDSEGSGLTTMGIRENGSWRFEPPLPFFAPRKPQRIKVEPRLGTVWMVAPEMGSWLRTDELWL